MFVVVVFIVVVFVVVVFVVAVFLVMTKTKTQVYAFSCVNIFLG